MKKICYSKGFIVGVSCFCMIVLGFAQLSFADLISSGNFISREDRPRWYDRYESLSEYDYRNYSETPTLIDAQDKSYEDDDPEMLNPVWHGQADPFSFDRLGNFLLPGGDIYNMTWDRSTAGAEQTYGSDVTIFDNLMISSDEFSNWMTKFMIGRNIRAFFTPSTLKRTNLNGVRWDASSRKNNFSFVASVGNQNLFGAHWQSILGDVLKLGGSFVANQRGTQSYSNVDISMGDLGLNYRDWPRYVYVAITSDSPEDENVGVRVYDVKSIIDGRETPVPRRSFKIPDILDIAVYSDGEWHPYNYFFGGGELYTHEVIENLLYSKGSWFLDLLNRDKAGNMKQLFNKGTGTSGTLGFVNIPDSDNSDDPDGRYFWNYANPRDPSGMSPEQQFSSQGYLEASGTDVIIYEFLIPAGARDVEFLARVANDYCIDIIAAMPSRLQNEIGTWEPPSDDQTWSGWNSTWSKNWSPIYDFRHCKKAPGKVNDLSNTEWVKISYDRLTGINVYGLNAELNWRGLFVRAEFNEYNALWAYPIYELLKGESKNKTTARAWFVNFEKDFGRWSIGGEIFDYPNEYMQYWAPIDDNDDNNHTTGGWEYPGLNVDWDMAPGNQHIDTNFSGQPFITYYYDSISFGDDFNHNGIIDERENDTSIDLPYDRDSRGQHYFMKLKPGELTTLSFGHYDIKQEYLSGRNLTDYFKMEHMQRLNNFFEIGVFHRTERVHDDYQSNKYYRQYWGSTGQFNNRAYKNSWVNTSMLKTRLSLIPNFNIINNFKYDSIYRVGDTKIKGSTMQKTMRAPRDIVTSSSIHKVDYTFRIADFRVIPDVYFRGIRIIREKRIREFKFQPQFKYIRTQFTGDLGMRHSGGSSYTYFPVVRFDYRVAPKTVLRFAMQGFPGLMEKNRNTVDRLHEIDRRRMFFGFETLTLYQGFNLLVTSGMRRDKQRWVKSFGRPEIGYTEYFITLRVEASR